MKPFAIIGFLLLATIICCNMGTRKTIHEVKRIHEHEFLALPEVVSVGIGRGEDGSAAIIVGVARLDAGMDSRIPGHIEGYPVIVRLVDNIRAQQ